MINKNLILLDKEFKTQNEVIYGLANIAKEERLLMCVDEYIAAVKQREKEFSTSIGFDVAIPHGKSSAVKESFIGFCRLNQSIYWNNEDNQKSKLIFLIGVTEKHKNTLHLKILAEISKKLMDSSFRQNLLDGNFDQVFSNLKSIEEKVIQKK